MKTAHKIKTPRPEIKCKDCKHFDNGYCKAFKFGYANDQTHYFMTTYQSRSNRNLCGPDAGLFSQK